MRKHLFILSDERLSIEKLFCDSEHNNDNKEKSCCLPCLAKDKEDLKTYDNRIEIIDEKSNQELNEKMDDNEIKDTKYAV